MFEDCLYFTTTSLARQLEREWTRAFKPFGLTPSQAFMLRAILNKAPLLHAALAEELNLTRPTVSRTLDGLEKLGLVKRSQARADGREMELNPTPIAIALQDQINAASGEVTRKMKKLLGSDEFDSAVLNLRGISASLK
jgi:DNA-binding MarR family transcriptional regulator